MPTYRVALREELLQSSPLIEADGPAIAVAQYVEENNLRAGRYLVQEIPETKEVEVTVETKVEASIVGQGGRAATVTEVEEPDGTAT